MPDRLPAAKFENFQRGSALLQTSNISRSNIDTMIPVFVHPILVRPGLIPPKGKPSKLGASFKQREDIFVTHFTISEF